MITVTGKIENAAGTTLHARVDFISKSTPLVAAGIITTNTDKSLRSSPADGTFSVPLAPGNYQVVISAEGRTTTFDIAVPDGSGTASIETLTTTPLLYTFVPPNTVWNKVLDGNITVQPVADPAAPVTAATTFVGGHQDGASAFNYRIAWQTANGGTTNTSPDRANTPPVSPNNATRVQLPAPPSGVTGTLIYRSNDGGANRYLLASVPPDVTQYDDWESAADFAARLDATSLAPTFNSTAGGIVMSGGHRLAFFCDGGVRFPFANCRLKYQKGLQLFNFDTGLWHTLICQGNPPQLGFDAGEA